MNVHNFTIKSQKDSQPPLYPLLGKEGTKAVIGFENNV